MHTPAVHMSLTAMIMYAVSLHSRCILAASITTMSVPGYATEPPHQGSPKIHAPDFPSGHASADTVTMTTPRDVIRRQGGHMTTQQNSDPAPPQQALLSGRCQLLEQKPSDHPVEYGTIQSDLLAYTANRCDMQQPHTLTRSCLPAAQPQ